MLDKRTILAFVIIALVFVLYDQYLRWAYPPPQALPDTVAVDTAAPPPASAPTTPVATKPLTLAPAPAPDSAWREQLVTVETERMRITLSSRGARVVSLVLKPVGHYLKSPQEIIPPEGAHPGFRFWTNEGAVETEHLTYEIAEPVDAGGDTLRLSGADTLRLVFRGQFRPGQPLAVAYTIAGRGYTFLCSAGAEGDSTPWGRDYAEVYLRGGLAYTEADTGQDMYYSKAYTFYEGEVLEDLKPSGKKSTRTEPTTGRTRWSAVRTKYFLAALIPETTPAQGAWMENLVDTNYVGRFPPNRLGVGLRLPLAGAAPVTPVRVFAGPLDEDELARVDPTLKRTMNWGWSVIAPFSKAVLWTLKSLFRVIPNYGVCIIIISVVVKLLVWPLTRKSYQSMAAMQKLQPQVQALRDKYKTDPQRLNKEMMKLYKENKVNPMGGCLPVLLQMPLLYALFIVFRSTIEFRQAPFVWWIKDLSMPDAVLHLPVTIPLYGNFVAVLPLLMGLTTYFQSKTTVTDPNQKFMAVFMTVFMTLIFNQFPSGLTLYYTLFNVLTLVQQKITPPPVIAPAGK